MVVFFAKVAKFTDDRLIVEIPKKHREYFDLGDDVEVRKITRPEAYNV